jgi:hypothetical protein
MQARTLHAQWAGDADATALRQEIPALLQHAGGRRASSPALALQLARLFERRAAAFDYRGPAESAPPAYMALANEIQVGQLQHMLCAAHAVLQAVPLLAAAGCYFLSFMCLPLHAPGQCAASSCCCCCCCCMRCCCLLPHLCSLLLLLLLHLRLHGVCR